MCARGSHAKYLQMSSPQTLGLKFCNYDVTIGTNYRAQYNENHKYE